MPYNGPQDKSLPKNVKGKTAKTRREWIAVWNSVYAACMKKPRADAKSCEERAFTTANGVIKGKK